MAKKNYYYVLVFTSNGAKYVTDIGEGKVAYWKGDGKPMAFTKSYAQSMVAGLNLNLNSSVMVTSEWELDNQPYSYEQGEFEWKWFEEETEE